MYCARGECPENRIKEQQLDLFADRTSTGKMWSNQLRLYFSSMAYVLLHTLRRMALAGTELERAQCGTIRRKLLKIGAQVRVTVRKIWVSLAEAVIPTPRCLRRCSPGLKQDVSDLTVVPSHNSQTHCRRKCPRRGVFLTVRADCPNRLADG